MNLQLGEFSSRTIACRCLILFKEEGAGFVFTPEVCPPEPAGEFLDLLEKFGPESVDLLIFLDDSL